MKTKYLIEITAISLFLAWNASFSSAQAQGSLTPPGAPGPTMLTLSQVQPRIPITSVPYTITSPGSYYLTGNMGNEIYLVLNGHILTEEDTLAGTNAITILANNVTVDLCGYNLYGVPGSTTIGLNGIYIGTATNVTVCNGTITDFGNGVSAPAGVVNIRATGLTVSDCVYYGIFLGFGVTALAESCTVNNVGSYGIAAGTIYNSTAQDCAGTAIFAENTAENCTGISSSDDGLVCYGTAMNCTGSSPIYVGIYAYNANNCYGVSSAGDEFGLDAVDSAINCYGANYSSDGYGLVAAIAIGCFGSGGTEGLNAYIANSSYSNTGDSGISYKYNMP